MINITISDSPRFPGAMQLYMESGDHHCVMQLDMEYLRKNLQKHILEGFELLKGKK